MTTIGVKYHNEDIHNIIRKPMSPTIKSPRYKSKRKFAAQLDARKKYNGHQTFGLAHYEAPEAKNYLKKGNPKIVSAPIQIINKKEFKCTSNCKNPSIPKRSLDTQKQPNKNFVKENIKKVITLEPKVPIPRRVETPRGTTKDLAHLIQMIKIRQSEEYAKIPKYLSVRKKKEEKERRKRELEIQAMKEYKEKMGIGKLGMDENVFMIDSETRQKILNGLKENWNDLSKQFLKLPVMTDTWPKIKRKMWLEKEIEQLEKDIRLVESHPYIYLERFGGFYEEPQDMNQTKVKEEPQQAEVKEEEIIEEKEKEKEDEEQIVEPYSEDVSDEKKEEDKELNILNY